MWKQATSQEADFLCGGGVEFNVIPDYISGWPIGMLVDRMQENTHYTGNWDIAAATKIDPTYSLGGFNVTPI